MSLETIIQRCKDEIEYRADYMCIPYEKEDIEHITLPDGHTVVLLKYYWGATLAEMPDLDNLDSECPYIKCKVPNIWILPPNSRMAASEGQWSPCLHIWIPKVHVRFPQLVMIIFPDGTIKKDDTYPDIVDMMTAETKREYGAIIEQIRGALL